MLWRGRRLAQLGGFFHNHEGSKSLACSFCVGVGHSNMYHVVATSYCITVSDELRDSIVGGAAADQTLNVCADIGTLSVAREA